MRVKFQLTQSDALTLAAALIQSARGNESVSVALSGRQCDQYCAPGCENCGFDGAISLNVSRNWGTFVDARLVENL